jgi:hypothetical protein
VNASGAKARKRAGKIITRKLTILRKLHVSMPDVFNTFLILAGNGTVIAMRRTETGTGTGRRRRRRM